MIIFELGEHTQVQEDDDSFVIITPEGSIILTSNQFYRLISCYAGKLLGRENKN